MTSAVRRGVIERERRPGSLRVVPVDAPSSLRRFLLVPWSIYADDPAWVPPLLAERRRHLSPRNPYFGHARFRSWIAYRGKAPVGRISAQVDRLHLERYRDDTGFFGMIEAEDDAGTFRALLETAEGWLRSQGMRRVLGPFSLSINDECGLLVDGFEIPPYIMMGHARRYYGPRIEEQGYSGEKDLLAYHVTADLYSARAMPFLVSKTAGGVHVRSMRRSRFDEELRIIREIYEDAWSGNWGFIPFTTEEFEDLGRNLKFLVNEEFVSIAEVDGVPAAMMILFPNINELVRDLNGRLLPFGWLKLLWRLKVRGPRSGRIPLMGVRRRYQGTMLGAALAYLVIEGVRPFAVKRGVRDVEMSWILEDNMGVRNIIESLGGTVCKRYRIYRKELA